MKVRKKVFHLIMVLTLAFSAIWEGSPVLGNNTVKAYEIIKTGICGDKAEWNFNLDTGVLNITGSGAMYDNPDFSGMNIKKVVIGEGITSVGKDSFISKTSITEVTFPATLETIGSWAFWGCEGLTEISLPASVNNIGDVAFEKCTSLENISVESGNSTYIAEDGILYSKDMKTLLLYPAAKEGESFAIGDSVETVGIYAFDYNRNIKNLIIPAGVKTLGGEKPFTGALSLTNIAVDSDNPVYCSIDGNLYSKDGTRFIKYAMGKTDETFSLPDGVTAIESRAFQNCTYLKDIIIPDTVISIGSDAFDTGVIISAYEGSTAFVYAAENGMTVDVLEPKTIESIEIMQMPKKLKFAVGDRYNSVGLLLKVNYTDGTYGVRNSGFDTEGFDSGSVGECTITVQYEEFFTTYNVEIVENIETEIILPEQTATVDIVEGGQIYYMNFIPDKTGVYTFTASSGSDTYGVIYDETGKQIASGDDTDRGSDFSITCTFEAGVTYIIAVAYSDEEQIGSFTVDVMYHEEKETTTSGTDNETTKEAEEIITPGEGSVMAKNDNNQEPAALTTFQSATKAAETSKKVKPAKVKIKTVSKVGKKSVKVVWKKAKNAKKYKIQYSTNKKFKSAVKTKSVTKRRITLKKLKQNKIYYIRVRAINGSKKGKWSKVKKIKLKK